MNAPPNNPVAESRRASRAALWSGYVLSALPVLMLLFSAVMKFVMPPDAAEGFAHLGIPVSFATGLGILELGCTILYVIPQTSVLGAILLTGYLGGAVLTHLRMAEPFFIPIILGVVAWVALGLRKREIFELAFGLRPKATTAE